MFWGVRGTVASNPFDKGSGHRFLVKLCGLESLLHLICYVAGESDMVATFDFKLALTHKPLNAIRNPV